MMKKHKIDHLFDDAKRLKLDIDAKTDITNNYNDRNILDFSDDVLLIIFSNLKPQDLLSVSETCERLSSLVQDKALWEVVDLRPSRISLSSLTKVVKFVQSSTKFIAIRGPVEDPDAEIDPSISKSLLCDITKNAPNLSTFILEDHLLDGSKVKLEDFPSSIEKLTLKSCVMINVATERSYFFGLDTFLPKIKSLDLSWCRWFSPHSLLALSKSLLEEVNLSGCYVSGCLAYASLAAKFGFAALKNLDLSFTDVSDTEVSCFAIVTSLRSLTLRAGAGCVTDQSITTYGGPPKSTLFRYNDTLEIVYGRPPCLLHRLTVVGYPGITNLTLRHVQRHMLHLTHLDVSRTSCSPDALATFSSARPDVHLCS